MGTSPCHLGPVLITTESQLIPFKIFEFKVSSIVKNPTQRGVWGQSLGVFQVYLQPWELITSYLRSRVRTKMFTEFSVQN